jgi:hypothetical protein
MKERKAVVDVMKTICDKVEPKYFVQIGAQRIFPVMFTIWPL